MSSGLMRGLLLDTIEDNALLKLGPSLNLDMRASNTDYEYAITSRLSDCFTSLNVVHA